MRLWLLALLLCGCLPFWSLARPAQVKAAGSPALCRLQIRGGQQGIASASLACSSSGSSSRPQISVAEPLLGKFKAGFEGVEWAPGGCGYDCILTICGDSHVELLQADVSGINPPEGFGIVCLAGRSRVAFSGARMVNNSATALAAGEDASVLLGNRSLLANNTALGAPGGGMVAVGNATVTITGGTMFYGNTARLVNPGSATAAVAPDGGGGGLFAIENAKVVIEEGSSLVENRAEGGRGGAVYVNGSVSLSVSGATLAGNKASIGGALAVLGNSTATISGGSTLTGNAAVRGNAGGVLATGNGTLLITGGTLLRGNAALRGSGGAVSCEGRSVVTITGNSSLLDNVSGNVTNIIAAGFSGGAFLVFDSARLSIGGGSRVQGNVAPYAGGGGLAAVGNVSVMITEWTSWANNSCRDGGGALAVDKGAVVVADGGSSFTFNNGGAAAGAILAIAGTKVRLSDVLLSGNSGGQGGAIMAANGSEFVMGPGTVFQANRAGQQGSDIYAYNTAKMLFNGSNIGRHNRSVVWLRQDCDLGEVLEEGYCRPCPPFTFGLDPGFATCSACPQNANCTGRDNITPLAGFWHSHPYSTQIHACPREGVCAYGGACAEGYTGNLCGACAAGYGSQGPLQCSPCMSAEASLGVYAAAVVVVTLFISWLVFSTLRDNITGPLNSAQPSDFLKLLVRHLQQLAILGSIGFAPKPLAALFEAAGWLFAVGASRASLDCIAAGFGGAQGSGGIPLAMVQSLVHLLAPLLILALWLLAWGALVGLRRVVKGCCCRFATSKGAASNSSGLAVADQPPPPTFAVLSVVSLVTLFFFFPALVRVALSFFACFQIDQVSSSSPFAVYAVANASSGYLVADIQAPCWQGWHKTWALALGIPCVLLFCIGVPLSVGLLLFSQRQRLQEGSVRAHIGFLYHQFREGMYFWEPVGAAQLVVLVSISVFSLQLGPYIATLMLQLCFAAFFVLQFCARPYASKLLNRTVLLSSSCMFLTSSLVLVLFQQQGSVAAAAAAVPRAQQVSEVCGAISLLLNLGLLGWCLYWVAKLSWPGVSSRLRSVWAAARARFSRLLKS